MPDVTTEIMLDVAEELRGTCSDLDSVLEGRGIDIDSVPSDMLSVLDDQVLLCDVCGWWCESSEVNDDSVCNECEE